MVTTHTAEADAEAKHAYYQDVSAVTEDTGVRVHNQNDIADMARLGKKQEFKRNFNFLSTLGFIVSSPS